MPVNKPSIFGQVINVCPWKLKNDWRLSWDGILMHGEQNSWLYHYDKMDFGLHCK